MALCIPEDRYAAGNHRDTENPGGHEHHRGEKLRAGEHPIGQWTESAGAAHPDQEQDKSGKEQGDRGDSEQHEFWCRRPGVERERPPPRDRGLCNLIP